MQVPARPQIQEYCICDIKVAPEDPEKVERDGRRYHRSCYRKAQPRQSGVIDHHEVAVRGAAA